MSYYVLCKELRTSSVARIIHKNIFSPRVLAGLDLLAPLPEGTLGRVEVVGAAAELARVAGLDGLGLAPLLEPGQVVGGEAWKK